MTLVASPYWERIILWALGAVASLAALLITFGVTAIQQRITAIDSRILAIEHRLDVGTQKDASSEEERKDLRRDVDQMQRMLEQHLLENRRLLNELLKRP